MTPAPALRMLTEAQLERYSRQIVLPDVGGRGQLRLLGAAVTLGGGADQATAVTATLLGRAGIGMLHVADNLRLETTGDARIVRHPSAADAPLGDVVVDLGGDATLVRRTTVAGRPVITATLVPTGVALVTLVGRPCPACLPAGTLVPPPGESVPGPLAGTLPVLVGALAASEVLRLLLTTPASGRLHRVGLTSATFVASDLTWAGPCPSCGGTA